MPQTENAKKWFFPPLNGGEFQGFSDSSTDNFKTTDNLGRESAQNSIGALRDGCKTVSMKYTSRLSYICLLYTSPSPRDV